MAENTKGAGRPDQPYVFKDATVPFSVREASVDEVQEAEQKRQADVDQRTRSVAAFCNGWAPSRAAR